MTIAVPSLISQPNSSESPLVCLYASSWSLFVYYLLLYPQSLFGVVSLHLDGVDGLI